MVADPIMAWILTVVFTAVGLYFAVRLGLDRRPIVLVGDALSIVMSAGMVAMSWPWWSVIPGGLQVIIFAGGAAWFGVLVIARLTRSVTRAQLGGHGWQHQASHGVMMLAMLWMVLAGAAHGEAAAGAHHSAGGTALAPALAVIGALVVAALLVCSAIAVVDLVICLRGATTWLGHTGDVATAAAMSIGMTVMCWPMVSGSLGH